MSRKQPVAPEPVPTEGLSREQQKIARWLKKLRFHKGIFGGIREAEVWKRMNELNSLYEEALAAERARCDALIQEARESAAAGKIGEAVSRKEAGDE